jgi:hypothetical protein
MIYIYKLLNNLNILGALNDQSRTESSANRVWEGGV